MSRKTCNNFTPLLVTPTKKTASGEVYENQPAIPSSPVRNILNGTRFVSDDLLSTLVGIARLNWIAELVFLFLDSPRAAFTKAHVLCAYWRLYRLAENAVFFFRLSHLPCVCYSFTATSFVSRCGSWQPIWKLERHWS